MIDPTTRTVPASSTRAPLFLGGWIGVGVLLAALGVIARVPPVAPGFVVGSVAGWTIAYRRRPALRAWFDGIDVRWLVALHVARLPIGVMFLAEMARGALAPVFARRAGYGDIAIGALALVVLAAVRTPASGGRRWMLAGFSALGLIDIGIAFGTGMYLLLVTRDPGLARAFAQLPYPLLPLLVVPSVTLAHLLVIARLRPADGRAGV